MATKMLSFENLRHPPGIIVFLILHTNTNTTVQWQICHSPRQSSHLPRILSEGISCPVFPKVKKFKVMREIMHHV